MLSAGTPSPCLSGFFVPHAPDRRLVDADDLAVCSSQRNLNCVSVDFFFYPCVRWEVSQCDDLAVCFLDFVLTMHHIGG